MQDQDVLSPDEEGLLALAVAIADGTPIDWAASTPSQADAASTSVLVRLQCLERLVRGHEAVRTRSGRPEAASAHVTLLTEARRKTVLRPDQPLHVQWGPLIVYEKIGRGSFGDVYRARDPRLDREVALKLVPEDTTESVSSPVVEEGRLLARVRHPNVLAVYGAERIDGRVGIWTEYVRGETLADEIARRGPLSPDEAARIGIEVCRALGAVHEAGLLHRDVKAQNILRDTTGRIVLGDFGTGVELDEHAGVAEPQIAGTPLYLAPEVFERQPATVGSDLYSAGVLLYFLVTDNFPVRGRTFAEIRRAHASGQRVLLREARPDLPERFVDVVEALLATGPDRRYGTAAAAERALGAWVAEPAKAERIQSRPPRAWLRTHRAAAAAIGLLLTSLVAMAVVLSPDRQRPLAQQASEAIVAAGTGAASSAAQNVAPDTAPGASPVQNVPANIAPDAASVPLTLNPRDWILVASFENRTGEAILDGTIDAAVKRELEYSFVTVAQRDRVEDALRLLNRPLDSRLDARLAREVSERDGGIRALLTGHIQKIGTRYVITSDIVNPANGVTVSTVTDEAFGQSEILAAVRRQMFRIREALGEPHGSVETSRQALAQVTLPPLKALQLYAQAARTMNLRFQAVPFQPGGPFRQIEQLARDALQEDPSFAPALTMMAWAISKQQGRPRAEYLPYAERALQLADTATPQERYFITGSVHHLKVKVGNSILAPPQTSEERQALEHAALAYEALLALQPDHYELLDNLRELYRALRRDRELASMTLRIADARPKNVQLNLDAARQLVLQRNFEAARRYGARAEAALSPGMAGTNSTHALVPLFGAYTAWLQDDPRGALKAADDAASKVELLWVIERGTLFSLYVALGRLNQAQQIVDAVQSNPRARAQDAFATDMRKASLLRERGDEGALRRFAAAHWSDPLASNADPSRSARMENLIDAGLLDAAERDLEWFKRRTNLTGIFLPIYLPFAGAIEIARGRPEQAIPLLQQAMAGSGQLADGIAGSASSAPSQLGASKLAEAWEAAGNLPKAIETLAESGEHRLGIIVSPAPDRWMRGRAQLARLYRKNGQEAEARTIEAHMLKLLAVADPDYPLLLELRARQ